MTTAITDAPNAVAADTLPAVCSKDQSSVTYALKEINRSLEREQTVTLYEIEFKNNGTTDICGTLKLRCKSVQSLCV